MLPIPALLLPLSLLTAPLRPVSRQQAVRCLQPLLMQDEPPPLLIDLRKMAQPAREYAASMLRVTPPWVDVCFGCISFVLLNALAIALTQAAHVPADGAIHRLLALITFALLQAAVGLPPSEWLRGRADESRIDPNPLFQSGSPLAGITFGVGFGLSIAVGASLLGIDWVPSAREWPSTDRALELLAVAPLVDEAFFRGYLLTAIELAGGAPTAAILASVAAYAVYQVPPSGLLSGGANPPLLLFELLGADLAWLYQRSGGSLPFVVLMHATFNVLITGLRAAQVGSTLPF